MLRYFLGTALKYAVGRVIVGVFFALSGSYLLVLPAIEKTLAPGQQWFLAPAIRFTAVVAVLAGMVIVSEDCFSAGEDAWRISPALNS